MDYEYWVKQGSDEPLFPDILWNKPENRQFAGKLLIIGGNVHGFNAPATAYNAALSAGVGVARVMLPNKLERTVHRIFPEAEYAPSTISGSFAAQALGEFLLAAAWADGVLLAGDIGKNAETTILFDKLLEKHQGAATLAGDMAEYASMQAKTLAQRPNTLLACTAHDLQKFVMLSGSTHAITSTMDMLHFVEALHLITLEWPLYLLVTREDTAFVAINGQVSTTPISSSVVECAAHATVWWLQNPAKPFESLTTALYHM